MAFNPFDPKRPKPDTIYDHIARINRMEQQKRAEVAAKRKKFGISGAFKFPKSKGANSAEMRKGK
jgi:hypothetical protein